MHIDVTVVARVIRHVASCGARFARPSAALRAAERADIGGHTRGVGGTRLAVISLLAMIVAIMMTGRSAVAQCPAA